MPTNVTIDSLKQSYLTYLQAQDSAIDTTNPNTYWQIIGGAEAASFLDLYFNLQLMDNAIYPQNSVGSQVDLWLYLRGLSARGGNTYGTINCIVTSSTPITIPTDTIFTDSETGNQYQTFQTWPNVATNEVITLYAIQAGNNYIEPIGNTLANGSIIIEVQSSTNGQIEESDQSGINRVLQSIRAPQGNVRTTDYQEFVLQTNIAFPPAVFTNSVVIPSVVTINNVGVLGVYALVGTPITEYQLNQGLLPTTSFIGYSRQAGTDALTNVDTYIQSQRLVGLGVAVGTSITYTIATTIAPAIVTVSLVEGYSLSTPINLTSQDINNNPITIQLTVEQLIQREFRRAICNQPFGGTVIDNQNYITINSIIDVLNNQLSVQDGAIVQILNDVTITNPSSNIATPLALDTYDPEAPYINYTYDIGDSYACVSVEIGP